jgi:hypothetical protein
MQPKANSSKGVGGSNITEVGRSAGRPGPAARRPRLGPARWPRPAGAAPVRPGAATRPSMQEGRARRAVEAAVAEDAGTEGDATVVATEDGGRKTIRLC